MEVRGRVTAPLALVTLLGMAPIAPADVLADAPSRFATLEGIRVHYKSLGEGPDALVFVHGWTCDLTFWRRQTPLFAGRRVLLVDLPGHGRSDKPEIGYTMTLFARAVEAVMREAGVEKAVLVGHSMGTPVVRQFYRLFPERTLAFVAVDGALRPFFQDPAQHAKFVDRYRGPDHLTVVGGMIDAMMSERTPPEDRDAIRAAMLATPKHVLVSAADGMGEPGVLAPDPVKVPVLAIGANPARWTAEYEAYLRSFIADLDFQVMDAVGHFLMIDDPDGFNRRLDAFLAQRGLLKAR